jgi:hypothetical protein
MPPAYPTVVPRNRSAASPILRGFLLVLGVLVLSYVFLGPAMDSPEAQGRSLARTAAAAGISILLFGIAYGSSWQRCAAMLGIALTGEACALSLIDAPFYTVLQRYWPLRDLLGSQKFPLCVLLLQSAAVIALASRRIHPAQRWLRDLMPSSRKWMLAAAVVVISANASFSWTRYPGELALATWVIAVQLISLALVADAIPPVAIRGFARWVDYSFEASTWDRRFPLICAAGVFLVSASLCWFVFGRVPHVPDEVSYLFQAKYFAAGKLYLPAPPDAASFEVGQVFSDARKWFGYGFPGWPGVLSLGVRAGIPWAVNPLLGAMIVLLAHRLISLFHSRRTAHAAILLLATSPWFLFMSASFMTHNLSLALALSGFLAIDQQRRRTGAMWSVVAGLCLGGLMLTRPLEGIVVGLVMGFSALGFTGRRLSFPQLLCFGVVGILLGSLLLPYNRALTGSALRTPQQVWTDATFYPGSDRLGFGADIGNWGWTHLDPFPGHGARDVVINIHQNLYMSHSDLFGWGCGSLLFVLIAILLGRNFHSDRLFLALIIGVVIAQSFYWFSGGPDYGARYWYQMLIPFIVLTVRGVEELQLRVAQKGGDWLVTQRIAAFVVCASLVSVFTFLPWRSLGKYHNFRRVTSDMRELAANQRFGKALVFVGGDERDYSSAFVFNPAVPDSPDPIYVRDKGPAVRDVIRKSFPDRPAWFVARSQNDHHFHVTGGPLPAAGSASKGN